MVDVPTRTLLDYLNSLPSGGVGGAVTRDLTIRDDLATGQQAVPPGGSTGEVLVKLSDGDFDTGWTTAGQGTVQTITVDTANGFTGASDGDPSNPTLTLSTTVTGLLKGDGTEITAAVDGTDFQGPITLTTTGTSGAATFDGETLNIPAYAAGGITQLTGDVTAGPGSGSQAATLASIVTAGTNTKITYDAKGRVTAGAQAAAADLSNGTTGTGSVVLDASPTLTGVATTAVIAMADNELRRPVLLDYATKVNALGSGGGARTIDLTLGNVVTATVSASAVTWTFSNPPASGAEGGFVLYLTNGGSQTVNWPASVLWPFNVEPNLTVSGTDVLVFTTVNGGTTWYGFAAGLQMS